MNAYPIPTTAAEEAFWRAGLSVVAGLDEAGRGPWAGPVCAAAVVLPRDPARLADLEGVRDSKTLSLRQRERCFDRIAQTALATGAAFATAAEIDALGIVPATRLAMRRALAALAIRPQALILDALRLPQVDLPQNAFPRADATSLTVAAAGIVAKVTRDRWMVATAEQRFPGYGFAQHKGYGTAQHQEALDRLGICAIHRRSFRPVADRAAADARQSADNHSSSSPPRSGGLPSSRGIAVCGGTSGAEPPHVTLSPAALRVVMIGPFGMRPRMTMRMRALPLATALAARGHQVTMLLPPWQNPEDAGRTWEEEGVHIENVALPRGVPGWFHWRLTAHLVRRARQLVPDVVHTFKPKAYAGLAHRALRRRYPVVVDTDDWEGPGGWNAVGDYPRRTSGLLYPAGALGPRARRRGDRREPRAADAGVVDGRAARAGLLSAQRREPASVCRPAARRRPSDGPPLHAVLRVRPRPPLAHHARRSRTASRSPLSRRREGLRRRGVTAPPAGARRRLARPRSRPS